MKTKDIKDLHTRTKEELMQMAKDMKADIYKMRLDHTMRKLKGTQSIFNKRKDAARVLTVLRMKELTNADN